MRLELNYYYSLTPTQFFNAVQGFKRLEEARHRASWEQARLVATMVVQVNSKKEIKPTDVIPFSWDKKKNENIDVDAERKRIAEKYYKKTE